MTGVMTQWMKDRLARQREEARQEGYEEGFQEGFREGQMEARLEARMRVWVEAWTKVWVEPRLEEARLEDRRQLNAWARQQELASPFPDLENGAPTDR